MKIPSCGELGAPFIAVHRLLSLVFLLLWSTGGRASVAEALGLSCSMACGIFLDQGLNLSPALQSEFLPLDLQGSLLVIVLAQFLEIE